MNAFRRAFGPEADRGPLDILAAALAPLTADSPAVVEHVLRFTACPWSQSEAVAGAVNALTVNLKYEDYVAWLQRFAPEGDGLAYASARALFMMGGRTDTLALVPWYHGLTAPSAGSAQTLLAGKAPGSFLVRVSGSMPGSFAISYVVAAGDVRHTRVHRGPAGYKVDGSDSAFATLADVAATLSGALVHPLRSILSQMSDRPLSTAGSVPPAGADSAYAPVPAATPAAAAPAPAPAPAFEAPKPAAAPRKFDVMISYCWADQETALKLRAALQRYGLSVWMDVSHMSATYLRDMISAVANSRCIVMCVSHKYLVSQNCNTEVNLVSEHRGSKAYCIVNLEKGLYPGTLDHPIAALAAGRLYVDFTDARSSEAGFQSGFTSLKRQLVQQGVLAEETADAVDAAEAAAAAAAGSSAGAGSGVGSGVGSGSGSGAGSGSVGLPASSPPLVASTSGSGVGAAAAAAAPALSADPSRKGVLAVQPSISTPLPADAYGAIGGAGAYGEIGGAAAGAYGDMGGEGAGGDALAAGIAGVALGGDAGRDASAAGAYGAM